MTINLGLRSVIVITPAHVFQNHGELEVTKKITSAIKSRYLKTQILLSRDFLMKLSTLPKSNQAGRITHIAFFLSLAAQVIPILYSLHTIATPSYYRGPLYNEDRLVILILGLAGVSLGILALFRETRSRAFVIITIILGLAAPIVYVFLYGSDTMPYTKRIFSYARCYGGSELDRS